MQRIDTEQPGDMDRWAAQLAVPLEVLEAAVRRVGTDIDKVKGYLAAQGHEEGPGGAAHPPD